MILEFPKWVTPDKSHIAFSPEGAVITVPLFPDFHVDREGGVTVLVNDAAHEAIALAAAVKAKLADAPPPKEAPPTVAAVPAVSIVPKTEPIAGKA